MAKYETGKIITGQVTGIEKYGIFVSFDEFYSGLIHISEISDGFVRDTKDFVNIGETIKAKIVDVDDKSYHLKLSIKNMNYRINKRVATKLDEVSRGFEPLEEKLDGWIDIKTKEIKSSENSPETAND